MVGGNVLTSQRVVDVILQAFGACAASQGCMNNVTLGTEEWGYYETVAGGSGAVSSVILVQCSERLNFFKEPVDICLSVRLKRVQPGMVEEECTRI